MYDATASDVRETQVDPIGAGASNITDPQSWNLYAYCGNDPINHTDPDGLFFKKLFKAIGKFFKGVAKFAAFGIFAFRVVRQAALKFLSSKWGQIAVAVALTILFPPAGPLAFALEGAAVAGVSLTTAGLIQAGVYAAGAVANHLQQRGDRRRRRARRTPAAPIVAIIVDVSTRPHTSREVTQEQLDEYLKEEQRKLEEHRKCVDNFYSEIDRAKEAVRRKYSRILNDDTLVGGIAGGSALGMAKILKPGPAIIAGFGLGILNNKRQMENELKDLESQRTDSNVKRKCPVP